MVCVSPSCHCCVVSGTLLCLSGPASLRVLIPRVWLLVGRDLVASWPGTTGPSRGTRDGTSDVFLELRQSFTSSQVIAVRVGTSGVRSEVRVRRV